MKFHSILAAGALLLSNPALAKDSGKYTDDCQHYLLAQGIQAQTAKLAWSSKPEEVEKQLNALGKMTDLNEYIRGFLLVVSNPNLQHEFKTRMAHWFSENTKAINLEELWPHFWNLAHSSDPKTRIVVYSALGQHTTLPSGLINRLILDLDHGGSEMLVAIWATLSHVEKFEDKALIAAMRRFYLRHYPGFKPNNSEWHRDAPDHVNAYNNRLRHRMDSVFFQAVVLHKVLSKSTLDKDILFNDCRQILFTDHNRQYAAFEILIKNDRLSMDLIQRISAELNSFKNEKWAGLMAAGAKHFIPQAEKQPELDFLIVELMQHPNVQFRTSLLGILKDRTRPLHPAALARLQQILPNLAGQGGKIAQRLIAISQPETPQKPETIDDLIQRLWRGVLGDSVKDTLTFHGITEEHKQRLRPLLTDSGEVRASREALEILRNFPWGTGAVSGDSGLKNPRWFDLPAPEWKAVPNFDHSMPDLEPYLEDRLGKKLIQLALTSNIQVHVMAATEGDLVSRADISLNSLKKIPNPYSTWDIDRYLDLTKPQTPRIIIRIQPNLTLAKHYQAMFTQAGVTRLTVSVSQTSRLQLRTDFRKAAREVIGKLGGNAQAITFGYEYLWKKMFDKNPDYKVHSIEHAESTIGMAQIRAQKFVISHVKNPGVTREVWFVGSDRTLWGEATVRMSEALIDQLPSVRDLTFLGSAGSLGFTSTLGGTLYRTRERNLVYGISVPHEYVDETGPMYMPNPLNWERFCSLPTIDEETVGPNKDKIEVALCSNHGFSNSPAEQSIEYTSNMVAKHISTLDVETSLVARYIHTRNEKHPGQKIAFGVVHLITDNPASNQLMWDESSSLTKVDAAQKQKIRENLLQFVLDKWKVRFLMHPVNPLGVKGLWNEGLSWNVERGPSSIDTRAEKLRDFFGARVKRLIYDNGQGRLDLQDGSYYVFSPDSSKTFVIPMATSRDDQRVTQPRVYTFAAGSEPKQESLKEFLLREIFAKLSKNGMIDLYRGAERDDERESWERGIPARGARYWTPNIDYAWRYARKQQTFLKETANGKSPIMHFQVPFEEFAAQVRASSLVLGTELPARTHQRLEAGQGFTDHLAHGQLYLGFPGWGVEIEIKSDRERGIFARGYQRSVTLNEMLKSRENQILAGYERALKQWPEQAAKLSAERDRRLKNVLLEVTHSDFESWEHVRCELDLSAEELK